MSISSKIKSWWNSKSIDEKFDLVFKALTTIGIVGGAAYCGHALHESKRLVNHAVSQIGDGLDIQISDDLVEDAILRAADKQAKQSVQIAANRCRDQIHRETTEAINEAVANTRKQITDQVGDRLAEACKRMNEPEIIKEIKDKAVDALTDKLDSNLDAITDEYSKNLDNMGKIYTALAEKLQTKA